MRAQLPDSSCGGAAGKRLLGSRSGRKRAQEEFGWQVTAGELRFEARTNSRAQKPTESMKIIIHFKSTKA